MASRAAGVAAASAAKHSKKKAAGILLFYSDKEGCPFREFSNFYRHAEPYDYVLPPFARRPGFPASVPCLFSEKAIMVTKAALMGDLEMFREIAEAPDPKTCKKLGRGVVGFDEELWGQHLEEVAFQVVLQKFRAEPRLRELLLSTGSSVLAEAAPNDRIWGVGLSIKDQRAKDPAQWQGRNVLGSALMRAREHLARAEDGEAGAASEEAGAGIEVDVHSHEEPAAASAPPAAPERPAQPMPVDKTVEAEPGAAVAAPGAAAAAVAARGAGTPSPTAFDCFAVLDFEATCDDGVNVRPQEIIEFPLVLVDARVGEPVGEFRTYVRPLHRPRLSAFCTKLTGIEQDSVDEAPPWSEALRMAQDWLDAELERKGFQRCAFVTCGDWDLNTMMGEQCSLSGEHVPARFQSWINIKRLFRRLTKKSGGGMAEMLSQLGLKLEGRHHSGLDDCKNIARILRELIARGEVLEDDVSSARRSAPEQAGCRRRKGARK